MSEPPSDELPSDSPPSDEPPSDSPPSDEFLTIFVSSSSLAAHEASRAEVQYVSTSS